MNVLVIGGGSIGRRHLQNLQSLGVQSLAVVEPDAARRADVCAATGATGFPTLSEGLDWQPTAVVIASPTQHHIEQALAAARHNCHLFIEKPLAHTLNATDELLHEVSARGLISLVGCNMRFHPGPALVKQLLDEGRIGRTIAARIQTGSYLPRWRPQQDYRLSYSAGRVAGGAILDCIHEIDLALWYFGGARLVGSAQLPAQAIGLETDGVAELILYHEAAHVLSNVHLNYIQRDYRRTCQIIGSDGTIYWDFSSHAVTVYGPDGTLQQTLPEPAEWQVNQMYWDEMAHFLAAVRSGTSTVNPIAGGIAALQIALAVKHTTLTTLEE